MIALKPANSALPRVETSGSVTQIAGTTVDGTSPNVNDYILIKDGQQTNVVSIMEFRDGLVSHESQYFAEPFKAPQWRAKWTTAIRKR